MKTWDEIMKKAMEENKRCDEEALKSLGFDTIDDFIASKLKLIKD